MTTATGYVLFQLGDRTFATPLDDVREIVRLAGLERLPGSRPPLAGVIVLRGAPLPVLDVREPGQVGDDVRGDVLVTELDGDVAGVAVDAVLAVLPPDELPGGEEPARSLPSYVVAVHSHQGRPVLLVDLRRLLDADRLVSG